MKLSKRSAGELAAILGMVAVVCTLAVLQYRWTGEISRSEQQRLKANLTTGVRGFEQEFSYDFERLCETFEIDPEVSPESLETLLLRQKIDWDRMAARPALIARVDIWRLEEGHASFESFDLKDDSRGEAGGKRFLEAAVWPERLGSLLPYLERQAQLLNARVIGDREALYYPWTFQGNTPALVRPIFHVANAQDVYVQLEGFLILEFNREVLEQQYVPDLVVRHFGEPGLTSFGVAVRTVKAPYRTIYISNANLGYASNANSAVSSSAPDAAVNLFESVAEEARRRGHAQVQATAGNEQWQLVVQDPAGSVDVGVAQWRRRNLAISFGLLAALAGTMVLLFSVARRAERLANLQMEFVAGVSHELCTPLAVINSAAENIVDGVVEGAAQVQEYGTIIREQGRRLERLVDEVLLFAAGRFGRLGYDLRPTEVAPILEQSLAASEAMLRDAGFTIHKEMSAQLPFVIADPEALGKCVENLISNAMKYSGENHCVALRAVCAPDQGPPEVQISVEDKGIGISPADLPHIFEPFYRAQGVRDGQVRGVGLGLYLVKRMMEAMGGRVSVASKLSKGSVFTLHFPAFDSAEPHYNDAAKAEVGKA
jgi:signal transduction histidine kinase